MENLRVAIAATSEQLQQAFDLRRTVFVTEQQVPEELEIDEYDEHPSTAHILALDESGGPVAVARIRPYHGEALKVERVAVLASHRGTGVGREMMTFIEAEAKQRGLKALTLYAQLQAEGFYQKLGYKSHGDTFLDAGIEHVAMSKPL